MAKKFYGVRKGKKTGVFTSWDECRLSVSGYPAAEYKGFATFEEAYAYCTLSEGTDTVTGAGTSTSETGNYAFVDGSFNAVTGVYGYGGFLMVDGVKHVISGNGNEPDMASMRNVAGEVLGSMAAVEKALELGLDELSIYFDYMGIKMWATGEWKRNKKGTMEYYDYIQSVKDKIKLNFVKVKGHSGVSGNEEADSLAKKAVGIN